jgi:hypothetical protein
LNSENKENMDFSKFMNLTEDERTSIQKIWLHSRLII